MSALQARNGLRQIASLIESQPGGEPPGGLLFRGYLRRLLLLRAGIGGEADYQPIGRSNHGGQR